MASPIDDVSGLPGENVHDQDGLKIGKVKRLYSGGDGDAVMWVTVETSLGIANKREVFVPLARLKHERDQLRVPYSTQHVQSAPDVDADAELSPGDDRALRAYYSVGFGDQELRTDNDSYAGQIQEEEGTARQLDAEQASEPEHETSDVGDSADDLEDKPRKATADDVSGPAK